MMPKSQKMNRQIPQPSDNPDSGCYSGPSVMGLLQVWGNQALSDPKAAGSSWEGSEKALPGLVAQN